MFHVLGKVQHFFEETVDEKMRSIIQSYILAGSSSIDPESLSKFGLLPNNPKKQQNGN